MTTDSKPVTRKCRTSPAAWGVNAQLVVSILPGGTLAIREHKRRESSAVHFDLATLYVQGVRRRIAAERAEKRKARASKQA